MKFIVLNKTCKYHKAYFLQKSKIQLKNPQGNQGDANTLDTLVN